MSIKHSVRKCPVCRIGLVIRADVRTCSDQCAKEWRKIPWEEKQRRLSSEYDEQVLTPDQVEKWAKEVVTGSNAGVDEEVIDSILNKEKS